MSFYSSKNYTSIFCISTICTTAIFWACCARPASAQGRPDPAGWDKARWGMTEDQVVAAFPGQAGRQGNKIGIPSIKIGGLAWTVEFGFDPEAKTLASVVLALEKPDATEEDYIRTENLLVRKYGRSWHRSTPQLMQSLWALPQTVITLERFTPRSIAIRSLTLIYERPAPLPYI